ncbi:MAG TPA: tRNA lysidine(34) synthetase TilS [Mucilaginibacter sp.]
MLPVKNFTDFIEQNELFSKGGKILAAVSGGMDSVILIHLLKAAGYDFGIAHCNFQLRGTESDGDEQFCRELAQQLGVPFHVTRFDTLQYASGNKVSTQMAARTLRYQWFEQVRHQHQYDIIALAHHQNDAIETILLNLTRGTGIAGLHGILPKNSLLVRPLLFLGRDEINTLVGELQIPYREDSSNSSAKYARNKIRLEVIPKLKELNPSLERTFERNFQHFRELEQLLTEQVDGLRKKITVTDDGQSHLLLADINALTSKRLLLFNLFQEYGFNETSIDDLIAALDKHPGRFFESDSYKIIVDRDKLILAERRQRQLREILIHTGEHLVHFGEYRLSILHDDSPLIIRDNPMAVSVDADKVIYPLMLRNWRNGDAFYPLGMKGKQKLSDFFIQQKVPLHKKDDIALLINGNGEIMWVAGYRPDERYKITAETKKVIIFEVNSI